MAQNDLITEQKENEGGWAFSETSSALKVAMNADIAQARTGLGNQALSAKPQPGA